MSRVNKYDQDAATVSMNLCSSTGTWLRGCLQPQTYYVHLTIKDADGAQVAQIGLSFEQAARMLMYNGEVECTLERYRDKDGKMQAEKITPPKSVHKRMTERLGDSQDSLLKRLTDLERDLQEMVDGDKKKSKGNIEELRHAAQVIKEHLRSNQTFIVGQAEEELSEMQNNAAGQIGLHIQSLIGQEVDADTIKQLLPTGQPAKIEGPKPEPVADDYELKTRQLKPVDDMNARQTAEEIHYRLRSFERALNVLKTVKSKHDYCQLYSPGAREIKGPKVTISYVCYQGSTTITLDDAKKYLSYLRTIKNATDFKRHYTIVGK